MSLVGEHKRWFIGGFVVLCLAIAVWSVGPFATALQPPGTRLVLVLGIVAAWLAIEILRWWLQRRRNRLLLERLAAEDENVQKSRVEAAELRARFAEAAALLARRQLGNGRLLYQLPWYIFIGPPGSGKTTSLQNSGLRFPLGQGGMGAKLEIKGVGGTRNCDWMFTDDAVLIDTAGRYVTQDSNAEVDQAAWRTFLKLLKQHRPRQPINGIIAALSVEYLMDRNAEERQRAAQRMRTRVEELQHELGMRFPVYLMITKTDLVSGFTELFAPLEGDARDQVWGHTFDLDLGSGTAPVPVRAAFEIAFPPLIERINHLLMTRLGTESDLEQRTSMYPFPQQFAALGPPIAEFIDLAFGASRLTEPVLLRGVYFTSGTQFGTPIDRVMLGIAQSLNLRAAAAPSGGVSGLGKSYFIKRLLSRVVFAEAGLAGFDDRRERRLRRLQWGLLGGVGVVCLSLGIAWTVSWFGNREALGRVATASGAAVALLQAVPTSGSGDLAPLVDALNALGAIPAQVHDPVNRPPLSLRYGLYQGPVVTRQVDEQYRTAVQSGLMPRIAAQLEAVMKAPTASSLERYQALKAYLMMYDDRRMEPIWFVTTVATQWQVRHDAVLVRHARGHLEAFLASRRAPINPKAYPRRDDVVAACREQLASASTADRAYSALLALTEGVAGVSLRDVIGDEGVGVLERHGKPMTEPLPPAFSAEAYRSRIKPNFGTVARAAVEEERWVLRDRPMLQARTGAAEVAAAIQARYFRDYTSAWKAVLVELQLRRPADLADAVRIAQVLARGDSPLKRLLEKVAEQTRLGDVPGAAAAAPTATGAATTAATKALHDRAAPLAAAAAAASAAVASAPAEDRTRQLEQQLAGAFSDVRRLAGGEGSAGEIGTVLALLNELATQLEVVRQRMAGGQGSTEVPPALVMAQTRAADFPEPVSAAIVGLAKFGKGAAEGGIRSELREGVNAAAAVCRKVIAGKYPFRSNATAEVGIDDFVDVFKIGGELQAFFTSKLDRLVDKTGAVWRVKRAGDGAPLPVPDDAVLQFQRADAIRRAFIGDGAQAHVSLDVAVVSSDGEVTLEVGGTPQKLRPGSPAISLVWPGRSGARLSIGNATAVAAEGAWALFRIVGTGVEDPASGDSRLRRAYTATNGAKAVLEFQTRRAAFNPFRLGELTQFACPQG